MKPPRPPTEDKSKTSLKYPSKGLLKNKTTLSKFGTTEDTTEKVNQKAEDRDDDDQQQISKVDRKEKDEDVQTDLKTKQNNEALPLIEEISTTMAKQLSQAILSNPQLIANLLAYGNGYPPSQMSATDIHHQPDFESKNVQPVTTMNGTSLLPPNFFSFNTATLIPDSMRCIPTGSMEMPAESHVNLQNEILPLGIITPPGTSIGASP